MNANNNPNDKKSNEPTEIDIYIPIETILLSIAFKYAVPILLLSKILSFPVWNSICIWLISVNYGKCIVACMYHAFKILIEPSKTFILKFVGKFVHCVYMAGINFANFLIFKEFTLSIYSERGFELIGYFLILIVILLVNSLLIFLGDFILSTKPLGIGDISDED